ncbi:DEAD/DEAH box helicase [Zhouia sp. PK063]|uniref:DEAD/DEAH box helicase n=1 Tax=Zhouia sp. PK063 TaxID=3373602 RepID=UPI0037A42E8D
MNKRAGATVHLSDLKWTIAPKVLKPYRARTSFIESALHWKLKRNLINLGYTMPTEIQEKALPHVLAGNNLVGLAAAGTGKTLAYLIPLIQRMLLDNTYTCLVIVPNPELAQQVYQQFRVLTEKMEFFSACFVGGINADEEIKRAGLRHNFVVGTPERVTALIKLKAIEVTRIQSVVIDELEAMQELDTINDVLSVTNRMKQRQQTILFTAGIKKSQQALVQELVGDAMQISLTSGSLSNTYVKQSLIKVAEHQHKFDILAELLQDRALKKVIVFAETRKEVYQLHKKLNKRGINVDGIHGSTSPLYKTKAIALFRNGKTHVLVATDNASRGMDVDNITHVINYQLPPNANSYMHRIGKTGRANKKGKAYTFIN